MTTERLPRLVITARDDLDPRYLRVICTGTRRNGRSCNRALGGINVNHPHDVQFTCHECGARYILQKS